MNKKRIWAILALAGAVLAYVIWWLVVRQRERMQIENELLDQASNKHFATLKEFNDEFDHNLETMTKKLDSAKADEIKSLFEQAFPKSKP